MSFFCLTKGDNSKLKYSIIGGNEHQIFSIDDKSGSITLINLHNFDQSNRYILNVSVSDGVYARSAKVNINMYTANKHNPKFKLSLYEVKLMENSPEMSEIIQLSASDPDGDRLKYSIISEECRQIFELDPNSGVLRNAQVLDR